MKKRWLWLFTALIAVLGIGGCELITAVDRDRIPKDGPGGGSATSTGGSGGAVGPGGTGGIGGQGGTGGQGGVGGSGGSPCIPTGDDVCDGIDNDCDPQTEDGSADPQLGTACNTGLDGICEAGTQECNNGGLECVQDNQPVTEDCNNSFDDDCDGNVNNDCPYIVTFQGDGDNCHKIITLDESDAIDVADSSADGVCTGTMLTTGIFGGYKQGVIDNDTVITVDSEAPTPTMVGAKCVVVSMSNMDNVTQAQLQAELLAPGFNPADVVTNCVANVCTYTKASQCNGGQFPMIGIFHAP